MKSFKTHLHVSVAAVSFLTLLAGTTALAADNATDNSAEQAAASPATASQDPNGDGPIIVTARRRAEDVQDVPVSVSVVTGAALERAGISNVGILTQRQPSIQFVSPNGRNTNITIRGLGANLGLANDGLEQGVGIYLDDVYISRPGASTFDFVDIAQVEVLRGPQGTLFGKNTTAGAISLSTRPPSFTPELTGDISIGSLNYQQARLTVSGPILGDVVAGRLSIGTTSRDGTIYNVRTGQHVNDINNSAVRGQLLIEPSDNFSARLSVDYARQALNGNTLVFVRAAPTLKAANQQWASLISAFNYNVPSTNPYDRLTDIDTPVRGIQEIYGTSATLKWDTPVGEITSISAWRRWTWDPSNDRDYTGLSVRALSQNPSRQEQISQEVRLASPEIQTGLGRLNYVAGLYYYHQNIETNGTEGWGADSARWLIGTSVPANLLDGYRARTHVVNESTSYAAFGQANLRPVPRLNITAGLRYTWENKTGDFTQTVSGGLATTDATLISRKLGIARPQAYAASTDESSPSGTLAVSYDVSDDLLAYISYSTGFKAGGINSAGIPTDAAGNPALASAVIRPEETRSSEIGFKYQGLDNRLTLNFAAFHAVVSDYQANVVDTGPGALRGYLANIEEVGVDGAEVEFRFHPNDHWRFSGQVSYADGAYNSFANGPTPIELVTSATTATNLSGRALPGVSRYSAGLQGEYRWPVELFGKSVQAYVGGDAAYRSRFNGDATGSAYTWIDGYTVANARFGIETAAGNSVTFNIRNAFDTEALNLLQVQAGNSGAIFGAPIDPRTFYLTFRFGL